MNRYTFYFLTVVLFFLAPTIKSSAQETNINLDSLQNYIEQSFNDFELNGLSVLIIKDDSIILDWYKGNAGYGKEINSESVYNIASCTKAFTGAAMAQLVEEGLISWNDLVVDFLPEFKLEDSYITTHLTIEDLLTHRSGLGTFYGDLLWYETDRSRKDIIERLQYLPITNRFRDQYGYQNTMYMVAAEILEQVTAKTWDEYIQNQFFSPLGMKFSQTNGKSLKKKQEIAYPIIKGKETGISMMHTHAAASLFSNTQDLGLWAQMLLNDGILNGDTILSTRVVADMMSPRTIKSIYGLRKMTGAQFSAYALGWNVWDHNGIKVVEHAGGMPGYISQVTLVPSEKLGIVILTNTLTSMPTALQLYILDLYLKEKTTDWSKLFVGFKQKGEAAEVSDSLKREESRVINTQSSLSLEDYVGVYEDKMYGKAEVSMEDDVLHIVFLPTKDIFYSDMKHWHYDTFQVRFADPFLPAGYITFDFNSRRNIEGFKIDLKSNDFHFFNLDFKKIQ